MSTLTPPTDNLYKFLAIVGLIIMAASLYWPLDAVNTWGDKSLAYVQGKTNAHFDQMLLDSDKKYTAATGKPTAKQLHVFEIRQLNINRQVAVLEPVGAPIVEYRTLFKWSIQYWVCIWVVGLVITLFGFWRWYYKLQKFQDKAAAVNPVTGEPFAEPDTPKKKEPASAN